MQLWGQEASDAMRALLVLRYSLLPHMYSLMAETAASGLPAMRPMRLVFPDDETSASMTEQFM